MGDDGRRTIFQFPPNAVKFDKLTDRRGGGGCGQIESQCFTLFSELGFDPILLSFQDWYFSMVSCLRWSCSLLSCFLWSKNLQNRQMKSRPRIWDIKRYPPSDFIRLLPKGRQTNFSCRKTKTNFHKLLFNYATTITVEKVFNSENKMNVNAS